MPIYEYECVECGERTEYLQGHDQAPLAACPKCGGAVKRLLSAPAFQFKGSGWYVTDYARKGATPEKGDAKASDGDSKAAAGDSKSGSDASASTTKSDKKPAKAPS